MPAACGKNRHMTDLSILHESVRSAVETYGLERFEILPCAPELADTAEFCGHYGISADEACNAILVALKTDPKRYVACLVRADTKLDVNKKVSALVGVKRLSFASGEETAQLTGMMIGGVTILGLPAGVPILIDERVMERPQIIVGGGNRSSKIRIAPQELLKLPEASVADIAVPR